MMQKYNLKKLIPIKLLYVKLKKQKKNLIRRKKVNLFRLSSLGFCFLWSIFLKKKLFFFLKKKLVFFFMYMIPQPQPNFFFKNVMKTWSESNSIFFSRFCFSNCIDFFYSYQLFLLFNKIIWNKFFFFKFFFFKFFFFKFLLTKFT